MPVCTSRPNRPQFAGDGGGGGVLLERQFRHGVVVTPSRNEVGEQIGDGVGDVFVHLGLPGVELSEPVLWALRIASHGVGGVWGASVGCLVRPFPTMKRRVVSCRVPSRTGAHKRRPYKCSLDSVHWLVLMVVAPAGSVRSLPLNILVGRGFRSRGSGASP